MIEAQTQMFDREGNVLMNYQEENVREPDQLFDPQGSTNTAIEAEVTLTMQSRELGGMWIKTRSSVRLACSQSSVTIDAADTLANRLATEYALRGFRRVEQRLLEERERLDAVARGSVDPEAPRQPPGRQGPRVPAPPNQATPPIPPTAAPGPTGPRQPPVRQPGPPTPPVQTRAPRRA